MSQLTILVSLLLIIIGEAVGETTCALHILEDAEEGTVGEQLFHFLFFPYTSPDKINYQLCETSQTRWQVWKEFFLATIGKGTLTIVTIWILFIAKFRGFFPVLFAYAAFRMSRSRFIPVTGPREYKEPRELPGRRKVKCHIEGYKLDKLRILKTHRPKPSVLSKLLHLRKANYTVNSLGKSEAKSQTHFTYRYQPVFHRLAQRGSDETLPKYILMDLLNAGTLQEKKPLVSHGRVTSFSDAREETLETLLKRKYDDETNPTPPPLSPEARRGGGGGDFVDGTNIPGIGRPRASSSFISNFDSEIIDPLEVTNDAEEFIIENNGNLSQGSFNVRRNNEQAGGLTDGSPTHREPRDNSWTHQSFNDWLPVDPSYLPNIPNDSLLTSSGAATDPSLMYDDSGDESAMMTTLMESFVSVSDSLQKTSTWYGSDDMEKSVFQWLSAMVVTKKLVEKAWTFFTHPPDQRRLYTSPPPPRTVSPIPAPESPPSFSPQFQPVHQQYCPEYEADLPQYEMVD